jgi:cation diffusion facilitator family transporter
MAEITQTHSIMQTARSTPFRLMQLSLAVSVLLSLLKFTAYYFTHANALLTDALESIINIFASAFALYSLRLAALPRDFEHPYGHGKIEFFSAGFEGALIVLAGIFVGIESVRHFSNPQPVDNLPVGSAILSVTIIANSWLGWVLEKQGKIRNSLTLLADGNHLRLDALNSLVVLAGLLLIWLTGWVVLDSLLSLAFALLILWNGYKLVRRSVAGLMDEADVKTLQQLVEILSRQRHDRWIDLHNLRVQHYGADWHIDAHLTLPYYLTLQEVHEELEAVKNCITPATTGKVEIFIHADPCLPPENCPFCPYNQCPVRQAPFRQVYDWNVENTVRDAKHFTKIIS